MVEAGELRWVGVARTEREALDVGEGLADRRDRFRFGALRRGKKKIVDCQVAWFTAPIDGRVRSMRR